MKTPTLLFAKSPRKPTNTRRLPGLVGYDFRIVTHDVSIVLLRPLTQDARNWIHDNVRGEKSYFGENLCVESRYMIALIHDIVGAGLSIAPLA
jgi:hypothetical protein